MNSSASSWARSVFNARLNRPVWAGGVSQNRATSPVAISTISTWSTRSGGASAAGARPPRRTISSYSRFAFTPPPAPGPRPVGRRPPLDVRAVDRLLLGAAEAAHRVHAHRDELGHGAQHADDP